VETLQAFGALFQIPHYYRKCIVNQKCYVYNYVIDTIFTITELIINK
jgi:hypothetical protein